MNKLWILTVLITMLMTVVACGGGERKDSVADAAASSAQQNAATIPDYGSCPEGKAPLHPDVVHGLVPSTVTCPGESPAGAKSPLHPDVVHGLVRPPFQTDLAKHQRSTGN